MPEMPEVEALRGFLERALVGAIVTRVELAEFSALKTYAVPLTALQGQRVERVERHGKFLAIGVDGLWLVFHLARAGWLRWYDALPVAPARPGKGPLALRLGFERGVGEFGLDAPGLDAPGLDAPSPGLDTPSLVPHDGYSTNVPRDGLDTPGLDTPSPGLDTPSLVPHDGYSTNGARDGLDTPGLDAPGLDAPSPGLDTPSLVPHDGYSTNGARDGLDTPSLVPRDGYSTNGRGDVSSVGFDLTEAGTQKHLALYVVASPTEVPGIAQLGPDPLAEDYSEADFAATLAAHGRTQLKGLLRQQSTFAGIGNAYSDEILQRARLSPFKLAGTLTPAEVSALFDAIQTELREAIAAASGLPPAELKDGKRTHLRVHGKKGEPCPTCGTPIAEVSFSESFLNYCPGCQTGGRLLADRRLSRLLK